MTATTLTSELEAINTMLTAADEAPVTSLAATGIFPLDNAKSILSEVSRTVQSTGWAFNTEERFPLARSVGGDISLPPNALSVDVDDDPDVDPVQRGSVLYDRKGHTAIFTRDLTATVVFLLAWDELPQPARNYIMVRATRVLQARSSATDSTKGFTEDDERAAWVALREHEAKSSDANMLRDSWSVGSVLYGREDLL